MNSRNKYRKYKDQVTVGYVVILFFGLTEFSCYVSTNLLKLVLKARTYLDPFEIFKNEPEEAMDKIKSCLEVLQEYKSQFENTRNTISKYFKDDRPVKKWEFANDLVFTRYDQFIKRVELIEVIVYC